MSGWTIAATMASTAFSAIGQYQQQQAAQSAARAQAAYNAQVARNNHIITQQNQVEIRDRGATAEQEHRDRIKQTKGAARAVQASQGFLVDDTEDSTNVQIVADIAEAGELDVLRIRDNTEREARRAEIQGINFLAEAGLHDLKGSSAQGGSLLAAGGTLLGAAAKSATIYRKG